MEKKISYKAKKVICCAICSLTIRKNTALRVLLLKIDIQWLYVKNTLFSLTLYIPWCLKTRFELTSVAITSQHGTAH